jgi:hypothetical protein
VRFWEHEGQKWKTLQLNGRKYSLLQAAFVHLILVHALGIVPAVQEALHGLRDALLTVLKIVQSKIIAIFHYDHLTVATASPFG